MLSQSNKEAGRRLLALLRALGVRFSPILMTVSNSFRCPYCSHDMPARWTPLYSLDDAGDTRAGITHLADDSLFVGEKVEIDWMACFNNECNQIIVRIRKGLVDVRVGMTYSSEEWLAVPRKRASRPIDPLVPDEFSKPYVRASLILEDAPDMSGILSRRILADLLKKYANRPEKNLTNQIDAFFKETAHPSRVKENLHHLREIGNFGAHTQTDRATDEIIDVSPDEAEWTLNVLDGLFDYFIVGPERDKQRRASFDAKIKKAGRDPLAKPKP